jgi:hypothetical protein
MTALRSVRWRYLLVFVLALAAAGYGLTHPDLMSAAAASAAKKPGVTARLKADPPPPLFPTAATAPLAERVVAERATANALFARWKKAHGPARDDQAFTAWVEKVVPAPPSATARAAELKQVQRLARTRTAAGRKAATWLEVHGKKDIWKLYLHDQRELLTTAVGDADKAQLKAAFKLAKAIAVQLAARYQRSAPYVLDPSLRTDKHVTAGQKCPCSYPSSHGALSSTAVAFLTVLDPHRAGEYDWMQAQVLYSRVYMAGHVPSDILAGALIGDLVGDYTLLTGGHTR